MRTVVDGVAGFVLALILAVFVGAVLGRLAVFGAAFLVDWFTAGQPRP